MKKKKLNLVSLSHSVTQSHNYAVVLGEADGNRKLPIIIGGFEAQAIAVSLEKLTPNRPLTHDLFLNTLTGFDITLKEIVISNLIEGIFYSTLILEQDGNIIEIDSRTSDAIAMAVRFSCPIYTYEFILDSAGVDFVVDEEQEAIQTEPEKEVVKTIQDFTTEELEKSLEEVLQEEDYERAAEIRDELNRRASN